MKLTSLNENIRDALSVLGFRDEAVLNSYTYADIYSNEPNAERIVELAAFSHTPPSYRSAAIGLVTADKQSARDAVAGTASLGAPIILCMENSKVSVWSMNSDHTPSLIESLSDAEIAEYLLSKKEIWSPESIHRAKATGQELRPTQLDFIDVGLLPALEGQIHQKLDELLARTVGSGVQVLDTAHPQLHLLYQGVFRLLAAKVLIDRDHNVAQGWDADDISSVLRGIENYYSLQTLITSANGTHLGVLEKIWTDFRAAISFANISSEDLAYVYENTFVTSETRAELGTHSTPRALAEYAVSLLPLCDVDPKNLTIYEPFAGAAVFLVAAVRRLREMLPDDWSDSERHEYLVSRLKGDEVDVFASEVATLSLILADYPNKNGWKIERRDLFEDGVLDQQLNQATMVVCNPPFEDFSQAERDHYRLPLGKTSKPVFVLESILASEPDALAIVLPSNFLLGSKYSALRETVTKQYANIHTVQLPDRVFGAAKIESSLLVASSRIENEAEARSLSSISVMDSERESFLRGGVLPEPVTKFLHQVDDRIWVHPSEDLWNDLRRKQLHTLGEHFTAHRGLEWNIPQAEARSEFALTDQAGWARGLGKSTGLQQFQGKAFCWLKTKQELLRGNAIDLPWHKPKILMNAVRMSRGYWRLAAFVDTEGLLASQSWIGLWPRVDMSILELEAFSALLNSPVLNAYMTEHCPAKGIRITELLRAPIPANLETLFEATREYLTWLDQSDMLAEPTDQLNQSLFELDAKILKAYGLSYRQERELLRLFDGSRRPVDHWMSSWDELRPGVGLYLDERPMEGSKNFEGPWVRKCFSALPDKQAKLLRRYGS